MNLIDILIEKRKREDKYFKNHLRWAEEIKKEAQRNLKKVKVYLFGSAVKGKLGPGSDIDILIISEELRNPRKRSWVREKILEKIGRPSPFELHLITPLEYRNWYQKFIDKKREI